MAVDIQEAVESVREQEGYWSEQKKRAIALYISALALVLAICGMGGNNAGKELIASSIAASDTWAFYQAKTIRQTSYLIAADELELLKASQPALPPEARAALEQRISAYRATVQRYDSEADGTGKRELKAKAQEHEQRRELAQSQDPYFDYAEALLQIAIVLASAAIVAAADLLLRFSFLLGAVGSLFTLNAFTLWVKIPFL